MEQTTERLNVESGTKFIGKVFLYMFIALLITGLVACGVAYLFKYLLPIANSNDPLSDQHAYAYSITLIVSLIAIIICGIWFNIAAFRGRSNLAIPFAFYATFIGVFGSAFALFVDPATLGLAFGITIIAFGSMALIGLLSKRNLNFLAIVAFGLLIGLLFLFLFSYIWALIFPRVALLAYWVTSGVIFAIVMLVTIVDVWRIKKIAERGEANNNLALYCAFNIYVDFLNIFVRVLYLLLATRRS